MSCSKCDSGRANNGSAAQTVDKRSFAIVSKTVFVYGLNRTFGPVFLTLARHVLGKDVVQKGRKVLTA